MLKSKHAVIAAAVFAAWSALPVSGQSTSVPGAGERTSAKTQAIVRLDDAARYREAAKYEAEKKRRTEAAKAAATPEEAKPQSQQVTQVQVKAQTQAQTSAEPAVTVMGTAQISWSAPEQPAQPVVIIVESPDGNPKN